MMDVEGEHNHNLAYIVGLTQLGLCIHAALAVPNQGRLATIIELIEQSKFSIHDLSRVEVSRGVPRFNMGDRPRAIDCLERAVEARAAQVPCLAIDPGFDSLRSEPRYTELKRKLGL